MGTISRLFSIVFLTVILISSSTSAQNKKNPRPPHIVFIMADDLGYGDLSWTDPRIHTPHLESLYNQSLKLSNYYVQPVCTPSRAALMTGMYPFHLGLQHGVIRPDDPRHLPLDVATLPEKLQQLGYRTAAVGKWHLGFCDWAAVPTRRGFDYFYGNYLGATDHFSHRRRYHWLSGFDLRENETVSDDLRTYSTTLFSSRAVDVIRGHDSSNPLFLYLPYLSPHAPIQVPQKYIDINEELGHFSGMRLMKAAMITALDEGIGNVTEALKEAGLWEETILVFGSDNGGKPNSGGMNYPYRGSKGTLYEGGTRSVAFVHGPGLGEGVFDGLFHITDWLPTLLSAATGKNVENDPIPEPEKAKPNNNQSDTDPSVNVVISQSERSSESRLDGMDQWQNLLQKRGSRDLLVYNINEVVGNAAVRDSRYKLIIGRQGKQDGWYRDMEDLNQTSLTRLADLDKLPGFPTADPDRILLFDLENDPYERVDLSQDLPDIVQKMYGKLLRYKASVVEASNKKSTDLADPANFNGVWAPGWCNIKHEGANTQAAGAVFRSTDYLLTFLCSLVAAREILV